ncbi:hypothetical protein HJC23_008153 [Cyclotella cryptica]|uniref:COG complex component COG2 C-terminal domain-containing protein n=1 Tax=Cyclotella cryptica TaxID=29204 RepID=A0ABD3PLA1_9STRA
MSSSTASTSYHPASSPSYASDRTPNPTTPSSPSAMNSDVSPAAVVVPPPPPPLTSTDTTTTTTSALQSRLTALRTRSSALSSELTKKLATSRSGQSLLHIGPSLSTLPPDLSTLLDALDPMLEEVTAFEGENLEELKRLVALGGGVRRALWRSRFGVECAEIYRDLCGAEMVLRMVRGEVVEVEEEGKSGANEEGTVGDEELHQVNSLERAAYTTLYLLQELQSSSTQVSAMTGAINSTNAKTPGDGGEITNSLPSLMGVNDSELNGVIIEKSRFLMKLAPRIRRLESDTSKCLVGKLEELLACIRDDMMEDSEDDADSKNALSRKKDRKEQMLLMIGNCLRGLALLGKGVDAESSFARVAIMPIIRSKLSMGKLDEGGSRGECAGLFFLLDDIANTVASVYGSLLRSSEGMFAHDAAATNGKYSSSMEVDLIVSGVWVPVATALMTDPGIKTAIFSPGIANVLQANYSALDTFLSELASNLLKTPTTDDANEEKSSVESVELGDFSHLYYQPAITPITIDHAQSRLYSHPTTIEFSKKWNLPIYYQLRFAEFCGRLDKALTRVCSEGWEADVFTGEERDNKAIRDQVGFELAIFVELYDILTSMWKSNVFLRPLTHRFLRGAVQLVGRLLAFIKEGMDGNIEFGGNKETTELNTESEGEGESTETVMGIPTYHWNQRVEDLAIVSWELTILDTCMTHDYLDVVAKTVCPVDSESIKSTHNSSSELEEIRSLSSDVLFESSRDISPLIEHSWNKLIVDNLISQCCVPLSAVKGVAATYRMTNRPPPTQASPFVATILRPLKEFDTTYSSRTPPQIGDGWKYQVIGTVADRYSVAVEELIATVKRTEEALKSRKTRRMMAGGMSDGEKVKLQLYLDHMEFKSHVEELDVDVERVAGLVKLRDLTQEAESLFEQTQKS